MVITNSDYGSVICGVIKDVQGGIKRNESVITMSDIDQYGNITSKEEKLLCYDKEIPLATKARRMKPGEFIMARVRYDIGDPTKSTCFEMKKQGIFKLHYKGNEKNLISGMVAKAYHGDKVTGVWIPTYRPNGTGYETYWYHVCFWNNKFARSIERGNYLIARCGKLSEKSYNGKDYFEASADKFLKL